MIEANEQKLIVVRKKLEELETVRTLVQENLTAHSSKLESLRAQLAARRFLSEEELRVQALMEAERELSTRCIVSENKSVLWRNRIISLLFLFVLFTPFFLNTLFVKSAYITFTICESNNKSLPNFAPSSSFQVFYSL